jgi:hypothetical protein
MRFQFASQHPINKLWKHFVLTNLFFTVCLAGEIKKHKAGNTLSTTAKNHHKTDNPSSKHKSADKEKPGQSTDSHSKVRNKDTDSKEKTERNGDAQKSISISSCANLKTAERQPQHPITDQKKGSDFERHSSKLAVKLENDAGPLSSSQDTSDIAEHRKQGTDAARQHVRKGLCRALSSRCGI